MFSSINTEHEGKHHPSIHSTVPPHLSHFQPPNRVHCDTVEREHQFSVSRMPPIISGSRYSLLCFAASGSETSSCIGLRMRHCHRSIRPLRPFSLRSRIKPALFLRSKLLSPIQKMFTRASTDTIFHRSIVFSGAI
jgi:hypothetical protein